MTPAVTDLCTLADVRAALELRPAETTRDTLIQTYITSASLAIMKDTQREFAPATTQAAKRRFVLDPQKQKHSSYRVDLAPYDLRSASLVTLHPESDSPAALAADSDYLLYPISGELGVFDTIYVYGRFSVNSTLAQHFGVAQIDITGQWGFASVPLDVAQAAIITVSSWLRRDTASFALNADEQAGVTPARPNFYTLPPAALRLLGPYRRPFAF